MKRQRHLLSLIVIATVLYASWVSAQVPPWGLGPFTRPVGANPIITPDTNSVFYCPMRGQPVRWEARHTFNPAAIVRCDQVWLFYRAEDDSGNRIGGYTSRLGLAVSDDGVHFKRYPAPFLYPADDGQKTNEWPGGCEDPRLVQSADGTYVLLYTEWNDKKAQLAVATSRNLLEWVKHGPALTGFDGWSKSGAIVCKLSHGKLVAVKIKGKYWMYWGDYTISCAGSDDLIHWDAGRKVVEPRPGKFDSGLAEAGPPAVLTDAGIVLIYNGENKAGSGDPSLAPATYSDGQALFDRKDPRHLLSRTDKPFYQPEAPYEITGQYVAGTTFAEGLVFFHGQWFLYYGCADTFTGVAIWNPAVTPK